MGGAGVGAESLAKYGEAGKRWQEVNRGLRQAPGSAPGADAGVEVEDLSGDVPG